MSNCVEYDVVIIGGGLVGASLAAALRHTSLKIALIEASTWTIQGSPSFDDRVIALAHVSQQILANIGIWSAIAPMATPIEHIHVSDQGQFGVTRLSHHLLNLPALGYVVSAKQIGQALQNAIQQSTITLLTSTQVIEFKTDNQTVTLQLQQSNGTCQIKTRLLVAADGGNSHIRQQLGIQTHQHDYQQTAIIANVALQKFHQYTAYERFTPSGPLALLPLQGNHCSLVWTVRRNEVESVMSLDNSQFLQKLQRQFGWRLGQFIQVGQKHHYPLHLIQAQTLTHERIVMIGNAAHTLHPVGGQGLNLGLRDVATLAELIVTTEDIGSESCLQTYEQRQQADHKQVIKITNSLVNTFSNSFFPLVIARNLGLLATDAIPVLKKQLALQMTGLKAYHSDKSGIASVTKKLY